MAKVSFAKTGDGNGGYDYAVMIDGEHRATFERRYRSKGYDLFDTLRDKITDPKYNTRNPWERMQVRVDATAEFGAMIDYLLEHNQIPTLKDAADLAEARRLCAEDNRRAWVREYEDRTLARFARRMYEALTGEVDCRTALKATLIDEVAKAHAHAEEMFDSQADYNVRTGKRSYP